MRSLSGVYDQPLNGFEQPVSARAVCRRKADRVPDFWLCRFLTRTRALHRLDPQHQQSSRVGLASHNELLLTCYQCGDVGTRFGEDSARIRGRRARADQNLPVQDCSTSRHRFARRVRWQLSDTQGTCQDHGQSKGSVTFALQASLQCSGL